MTFINRYGEKCRQLFDKENFKNGAKFSPDIETSKYKL
jgi:hypothetical protein